MAIGSVTFGGLASGLPADLVDNLVDSEKGRLDRYTRDKEYYEAKKTEFGKFESTVLSLTSSIDALKAESSFKAYSASSSDSSYLTVSASSTATPSTMTIRVNQKALNAIQVLDLTNSGAADSGIAATEGTALTTEAGGGAFSFDFGGATHSYTIDTSDAEGNIFDLADLVDSINDDESGVTASIMNDGDADNPYRLMLTADESGVDNDITNISATDISAFGLTGGASSTTLFDSTQTAQDAELYLGGATGTLLTSSTNTFNDAIKGLTLNVIDMEAGAKDITVSVAADPDSVKTMIETFVTAYNSVTEFYNVQNNKDEPGILKSDATSRTIVNHLRSLLTTQIDGLTGDYTSLADLGITTAYKTGLLTIDSAKLGTALAEDVTGIGKMFFSDSGTGRTGLGDVFGDYLDDLSTTFSGVFASRKSGLATRISNMEERVEKEGVRLERIREKLTMKYAALEQLINSFQTSGSSLVQSINSLPMIGGNR